MTSRYTDRRGLRRYLAGAAAARAGDEMSGPALLMLGFAVTGRPETGSGLLACLTIAGAAGGPLFGALGPGFHYSNHGFIVSTLVAVVGAIIVLAIWNAITGHRPLR